MSRAPLAVILLCLSACDPALSTDCPPAFEWNGEDACVFSEPAVAEIMRTYDQGDLVKINTAPFPQITDPGVIRNVWITPLPTRHGLDTVDLYRLVDPDGNVELPGAFPMGTVIVHERVDREEGSTVQVRREPGYESDGGGPWWFGKYHEDGTPDLADCIPCFACHTLAIHPGSEGLWGVPASAQEPEEGSGGPRSRRAD